MATSYDSNRFLVCEECGEEFVFTTAAQRYFSERGLTHDPTKCKYCYSVEKREKSGGQRAGSRQLAS